MYHAAQRLHDNDNQIAYGKGENMIRRVQWSKIKKITGVPAGYPKRIAGIPTWIYKNNATGRVIQSDSFWRTLWRQVSHA